MTDRPDIVIAVMRAAAESADGQQVSAHWPAAGPASRPAGNAWGWSFALAVLLHVGLLGSAFSAAPRLGLSMPRPQVEQLIRGTLVFEPEPAPIERAAATTPHARTPVGESARDTAATEADVSAASTSDLKESVLEPDPETIRQAAAALASAPAGPPSEELYDHLLRDAERLERISSPEAVVRMAEAIRQALNAPDLRQPTTLPADGEPFDFDRSVLTEVQRVATGGTVEIQETLRDPVGRMLTVVTRRRPAEDSGEDIYEQTLLEPGQPPSTHRITAEDFAEAEARYRPFEVINRFPLVKLLHQEAVLPLLRKISEDPAIASRPAEPCSQPAGPALPAGPPQLQ